MDGAASALRLHVARAVVYAACEIFRVGDEISDLPNCLQSVLDLIRNSQDDDMMLSSLAYR